MATGASNFPVIRLDPGAIRPAELDRLVEILAQGGAVDPETARLTLPHCCVLLVATTAEDEIIGVGAIKPPRAAYTAGIQNDSGIKFDLNTPELGYVAMAKGYKGHKISRDILRSLLEAHPSALFCTTDAPEMIHMLPTFGFVQAGRSWAGKRDQLSCWVSSDLKWTS